MDYFGWITMHYSMIETRDVEVTSLGATDEKT